MNDHLFYTLYIFFCKDICMFQVIDIVSSFGHCLPYGTVSDIRTAAAESALVDTDGILPIKPILDSIVSSFFWVDNFDILVDKLIGGSSINTTHLMAFQEESTNTHKKTEVKNVGRQKKRKLSVPKESCKVQPVNSKQNPPTQFSQTESNFSVEGFHFLYFIWTYGRKYMSTSGQQLIPGFKGWLVKLRLENKATVKKTHETFLPPINAKVTEFSTIQKYLEYLQNISKSANMKYVNVTLDVGAAINAYKTIWCHPERFGNVIIHLGSFHFIKENFKVCLILFT